MENSNSYPNGGTVGGTLGGTLLVVLLQIKGGDILKTCVMAAIGAVVSFLVSVALKWLFQQVRGYFKSRS